MTLDKFLKYEEGSDWSCPHKKLPSKSPGKCTTVNIYIHIYIYTYIYIYIKYIKSVIWYVLLLQ